MNLKIGLSMKRLFLVACMCLCGLALMAQERQVTGVVYNKEDNEPMVGAEVSVDGISLTTVTDIDGRFILKNVPADARTVKISSIGMVTMRARIPQEEGDEIKVVMERVERKFSPFVKAGVAITVAGYSGSDLSTGTGVGFIAGVGASIYLSRYFSLTPSLNILQKSFKIEDLSFKPVYLHLPLLVENKLWLKRRGYGNRLLFNYGPYVSYGIAGKTEGIKLFSKDADGNRLFQPFDAGLHVGFGAQLKHLYLGLNAEISFVDTFDDWEDNESLSTLTLDFSVGYRF